MIFRHEWAFIRLVVRPLVDGAFLFVVATGVVVGLAAYIWFGAGSDEGVMGRLVKATFLKRQGKRSRILRRWHGLSPAMWIEDGKTCVC